MFKNDAAMGFPVFIRNRYLSPEGSQKNAARLWGSYNLVSEQGLPLLLAL